MANLLAFCVMLSMGLPLNALARMYDIYRADFTKGAFCSAIGGACAADNDPENSFFENPAALQANQPDDLVYDGDYSDSGNPEPGMKEGNTISEYTYMGGIALSSKTWGYGLSVSGRFDSVKSAATIFDDAGNGQKIKSKTDSNTVFFQIPFVYRAKPNWSLGAALIGMYYTEKLAIDSSTNSKIKPIDKFPQIGLAVGTLYKVSPHLSFGLWGRSPITFYIHQEIQVDTPTSFISYQEDIGLMFPWLAATGVALKPWADERTFFADLTVVGQTPNGFERTLDTFSSVANDKKVRRKGSTVVAEPHLGWRSPWTKSSQGTFLAGSYFETSRWEGLNGRIHGTAGLAYKVGNLTELLAAVDVAKNYLSIFLTFR